MVKLDQFLRERQENVDRGLADNGPVKLVSPLRRAISQVIACTVKNLILLDIGMTIGYPTIVVPVLLQSDNGLHFTPALASWFGSIGFLCQPLGSVLSGVILEPLGRKYGMIVVNLPQIVGWYLFYIAESLYTVFAATILLGFGSGFAEAPVITYVGEISEPRLRGRLISYSEVFFSLGIFVIYGLGNLTSWQNVAGISCFCPLVTMIALTQIPESPIWLASKNRFREAEAALCWLRGWVKPQAVFSELKEILQYTQHKPGPKEESVSYSNPVDTGDEIINENNLQLSFTIDTIEVTGDGQTANQSFEDEKRNYESTDKKTENKSLTLKEMIRPEILKPFGLITGFFFFFHTSGISPMRPYFLNIFEDLNFPIGSNLANVIFSIYQFFGIALCLITVPWIGKRPIALLSMLVSGVSAAIVGLYVIFGDPSQGSGWLPFSAMSLLQFSNGYGVAPLPWMLISEIFPNRGRALAIGVVASLYYLFGFVAIKSFLSLEDELSLGGVLLLFGCFSFVGTAFLYFTMPETEGLSLAQIEQHYKTRDLTKCVTPIKHSN